MTENISWTGSKDLETEIAELSRQIEVKRQQLESEKGIVSDREIVSEAVAETFSSPSENISTTEQIGLDSGNTPIVTSTANNQTTDSYLNTLDDQAVTIVNNLIAMVPIQGIRKTIKQAITNPPFILDAFHDALIDKLYDELKTRGLVS